MYPFIVIALNPRNETQKRQYLRLNSQSNVELFDDVVYPKRDTSPCPEHHHRRLKTRCIMTTVVNDDLGNQL
jgi:hypothetical protein